MERYLHKDGATIVDLVEVDSCSWYCFVRYDNGVVKPISEEIFFRDFKKIY